MGLQFDFFFICLWVQGILLVKHVLPILVLKIEQSGVAEVVPEHRDAGRVASELETRLVSFPDNTEVAVLASVHIDVLRVPTLLAARRGIQG